MSDTTRTDAAWKKGKWSLAHEAECLERELNAAQAELAQLREDKARLDWMESFDSSLYPHVAIPWPNRKGGHAYTGKDIRPAIDAARKARP